jgi:hypothetical protein
VPIRDSDRVTVLGYQGGLLHWTRKPAAAREAGSHVWTFEVSERC